jgi:CheY-like chemotaxis protein
VSSRGSDPPDLILCDDDAGMDGFGALEALRAEPRFAEIPFIFLTASTTAPARAAA